MGCAQASETQGTAENTVAKVEEIVGLLTDSEASSSLENPVINQKKGGQKARVYAAYKKPFMMCCVFPPSWVPRVF